MHTEPDAHRPGRLAFGEQFADHRSCPQSGILVSGTKVPPFMLCPQVLRSLLLSSHVLFTPLFSSHPKDAPQTPPVWKTPLSDLFPEGQDHRHRAQFLTVHLTTLRPCQPALTSHRLHSGALKNNGPRDTQAHGQWQGPKKAALWGRKDQIFANFHAVNISTSVHFKLPTVWQPACKTRLFSHEVVPDPLWPHGLKLTRLLCLWDFPGKNAGMGCHFLLQGISLTQGLNPGLLQWKAESLPLSPGKPCKMTGYFINGSHEPDMSQLQRAADDPWPVAAVPHSHFTPVGTNPRCSQTTGRLWGPTPSLRALPLSRPGFLSRLTHEDRLRVLDSAQIKSFPQTFFKIHLYSFHLNRIESV